MEIQGYFAIPGDMFSNSSRTEDCRSNFMDKPNLQWLQHVVVVLYLIIMIASTVVNAAVVYAIVTLNLYNRAMFLVLVLSIADLGVSIVGMPLCLAVFMQTKKTCNLDLAAEFFCMCFGHLTAYITAVVGYDCYFSMKYLTDYQRIIRRWKVYVTLITVFTFSVLRSGVHTLGVIHDKFFGAAIKIGMVADLFVLLLMLPPYALTACVIRRHIKNAVDQHLLNRVAQPVNSIAFRRVIATMILYIPIVVLALLNRYLPKDSAIRRNQVYLFAWSMSYGLMGLSSFVNAVIFVWINASFRRQIIRQFSHKMGYAYSKRESDTKEAIVMGRIDISPLEASEVAGRFQHEKRARNCT